VASSTLNPVHDVKIVAGSSNVAWATFIAHAGTSVADATSDVTGIDSGIGASTWFGEYALLWTFDLSSLGAGATVNTATLRLYVGGETTNFDLSFRFLEATPADPESIVASDLAQVKTTKLVDTDWTHAFVTTSAYNEASLNAAGIAVLEAAAGGFVTLATRPAEILDDVEPTWISSVFGGLTALQMAGAANPPELVLDFTVAASGGNRLPSLATLPSIPLL
jgi:hypothetical protein